MTVSANDIEDIFSAAFLISHHTILCGGFSEPEYIPALHPSINTPHQICYRSDYLSSALHEVAHWSIAGAARRKLKDYGYFYNSGHRSHDEQKRFLEAELLPQTIESWFHQALGIKFEPSLDAFHFSHAERKKMESNFLIEIQAKRRMLQVTPPIRAVKFHNILQHSAE